MVRWFRNFISALFPSIPPKQSRREIFEKIDSDTDERLKDCSYWQKIRGEKESEYKSRLLTVYRSRHFVIQGLAELLPPTEALQFVDDLASAGFVVKKVIGWEMITLPDGKYEYYNDLACDFCIDIKYLYREHPVKESVPIIKEYIAHLPEHISHIYLEPFTPLMWDWELFPEKWQAREQNQAKK